MGGRLEEDFAQPSPPAQLPGLFTREFMQDPYPTYSWLRSIQPVAHVVLPRGVPVKLVTSHEAAREALADPRLSKNPRFLSPSIPRQAVGLPDEFRLGLGHHMVNADPPDHRRLRRVAGAAFTPRRTELLRSRVEAISAQLLDPLVDQGHADFMAAFAHPLPTLVLCELLGVPLNLQAEFREITDPHLAGHRARGRVGRSGRRMRRFVRELIDATRRAPGENLLADLVLATDDGELNESELISTVFLLLIAGHGTSINLLGNGLHALLTHSEQLQHLRGTPALLGPAIEELLRFDSPVDITTWRFAAESFELAGSLIRAGDPVLVSLGAANRDPAAFHEPNRLELSRAGSKHVAFGFGIHYCLGAPLARLQGEIVFAAVLDRLPDLRLDADAGTLRWRSGLLRRGLEHLPIAFRHPGSGQCPVR
ncbi:cytochrome P450 family protein [Kribbella sindirgiensis]|uniref:Cytochrome P450 n=1 Tax=Kribbella sindirgiensis TaxID=1124744 RepID=A0A4R0J186_9ACTN|nr:cytochrome P450 [Kribbella sindirgiensis]TCC34895.1 cytochrome P450 [Kribbella sindirgiensis]